MKNYALLFSSIYLFVAKFEYWLFLLKSKYIDELEIKIDKIWNEKQK